MPSAMARNPSERARSTSALQIASLSTVLNTAVQGLALIQDREAIPALRKLATSDPDLRVREAAIEGLKKLDSSATAP